MIAMMPELVPVLEIVFGLLALVAGRRLFWLFAAVIGFTLGMNFGLRFGSGESTLLQLAVALAAGLAGALLGWFLPRVAAALVGFLAGSALATSLLGALFPNASDALALAVTLGSALLGAAVAWGLLDVALAVISALWGAALLVRAAERIFAGAPGVAALFTPPWELLLVLGLALAGVVVQLNTLRRAGR